MARMRSGVGLAVAFVAVSLVGCGGGSATPDASGVDGGAGAPGAAGSDGGEADLSADAETESTPDLATDFAGPTSDVATRCPTAAGALAPAEDALVIDDFDGTGRLDGRIRTNGVFTVKEQFDATATATFDPAPAIEASCGAAAPGAAHIRGRAADTGATFAIVFSTPVPGTPAARYDASGTTGISFRIALGDASASKLVTVQVNLAGSPWDYTKDVAITGTTWQTVTIPWSDLQAAPGAPAFSAAALNQLVFPFFADTDIDLYLDDVAFVK